MRGPTIVDAAASADAYRELHAKWDMHVDREAKRLTSLGPSVQVANIPYLSLAAAKHAGVPAVALCSLNWLEPYRIYCGEDRDAANILSTIEAAYQSADVFLQPRPHMPMAGFKNRLSIGPIARRGRKRTDEVKAALGIPRPEHLALVTFGGIPSNERLKLPSIANVRWLVADDLSKESEHVFHVSRLKMSFIDILASCDVVVTKVGYGTFTEAACNGVRVVTTPRDDWPETAPMMEWMKRNANIAMIQPGDKMDLSAAVISLLDASIKPPVAPSGIDEAADVIARMGRLSE